VRVEEGGVRLRPEDLARISLGLREELESAVVSLDSKRIAAAIGKVSEQDAALGKALSGLAERLAYTSIHDALQGCKALARVAG
jgi:hypothetical protein